MRTDYKETEILVGGYCNYHAKDDGASNHGRPMEVMKSNRILDISEGSPTVLDIDCERKSRTPHRDNGLNKWKDRTASRHRHESYRCSRLESKEQEFS